jgi:hypothetical protein
LYVVSRRSPVRSSVMYQLKNSVGFGMVCGAHCEGYASENRGKHMCTGGGLDERQKPSERLPSAARPRGPSAPTSLPVIEGYARPGGHLR